MKTDMNVVILSGRFVRDPELKTTQSGTAYCKFSIASNFFAGKGKEAGVSFFDCVVWSASAETISTYMKKGSLIYIEGELRQNRYTTKEGAKRSSVEINVSRFHFGPKRETENQKSEYAGMEPPPEYQNEQAKPPMNEVPVVPTNAEQIDDDDIPF